MREQKILRSSRVSFIALCVACAALLFAGAASTQTKKPITKQGLVNAVKINGLSTRELVAQIERRGVDFQMSASDESDLQSVGARPEIIEAARSNYRPAVAAARPTPATNTTGPPRTNTTGPPSNVPDGPPLSKSEIVTMLQGGISPARVEQFVEKRGVNFQVTREVAQEITAAGGNRSLIGAITEKSTADVASNNNGSDSPFGPTSNTPANNAPDYDDLIDHATSAVSTQDYNGAIRYAQQAAQLDPQQPTAYSIIGTLALYYSQNVSTAEQAMRAAIERGGTAAFHVYHDHDGAFGQYCEGSFFITKTGVSFKANDGRDTFETDDSNIKEAKTNAFMGAQYGAFHIKPVTKINGRDNFNFAPATQNKAEAELIIRMIKGY
jgi:hypothetical protein